MTSTGVGKSLQDKSTTRDEDFLLTALNLRISSSGAIKTIATSSPPNIKRMKTSQIAMGNHFTLTTFVEANCGDGGRIVN